MTDSTRPAPVPNGAGLAAALAAGIGSLGMGMFVLANEAGIYAAPALYPPAGGLSGRSTLAVIVWLVAWAALHARWKGRTIDVAPVLRWTMVLALLGVVMCFPPVWGLVG